MSRRKIERLLNLLCCFYKSKKPLSLTELREIFEPYRNLSDDALRQKFFRDRKDLEGLGIYIDVTNGKYFLKFPDIVDRLKSFEKEEKETLAEILKESLNFNDLIGGKELQTAVSKVAISAGIFSKIFEKNPALEITLTPDAAEERIKTQIGSSIETRNKIRIIYRSLRATSVREYEVCPVKFVLRNGEWYVAALDGNVLKTFKLKRIEKLEILDENFEKPEEIDRILYDDLKVQPWRYPEEDETEVVIEANPEVAKLIAGEFGGFVESEEGGLARVRIKIGSAEVFMAYFSKYLFAAEIVEPEDIKDKVTERVKKALECL